MKTKEWIDREIDRKKGKEGKKIGSDKKQTIEKKKERDKDKIL